MNDVSNISDINYGLKDETGVLSHIKGKIEYFKKETKEKKRKSSQHENQMELGLHTNVI